jgi:hypothetical protein
MYGWAGLLVDWIDFEKVRMELVPNEFHLAKVLQSDTLSGHYLGSYVPVEGGTFERPFHEFGRIVCNAEFQDEKGFWLGRMAVDHPLAQEGGKTYWGVDKIPGAFEDFGDYGQHVRADDGRLQVSLQFKKLFSLGYWNTPFSFFTRKGTKVLRFQIAYHGELFLCRSERKKIFHEGRLIPLLFDRCWITMEAPEEVGEVAAVQAI